MVEVKYCGDLALNKIGLEVIIGDVVIEAFILVVVVESFGNVIIHYYY